MEYVLICKTDNQKGWDMISNPNFSSENSQENRAKTILLNSFNEYVEWRNCGVRYRVIRKADLGDYT